MEVIAKQLIQSGVDQGASDIHLIPHPDSYQVFWRTGGRLIFGHVLEVDQAKKLIAYFKYQADMDVGERRRPQSGSCSYQLDQEEVELRFSTITNYQLLESLVIRILRQAVGQEEALQVIFPQTVQALASLVRRRSGLVLFSGPVGSGKTTLIYHLLRQRIQGEPLQVITMEDPVEISEAAFLQTEVNDRAGITYDLLIKSSLRHHPDILMIGEIRDEETARMVVRGALTGHLMIATIHAKNARGVLARLQELGVSQEQLKQTLIGIISQRLLPIQGAPGQRGLILETLAGPGLATTLKGGDPVSSDFQTLNDYLRKAWAYGFISKEDYQLYEIL
ncbi:competence type IV pilus ATPase ComGA [Hutsoniella sourekii]|uniref:competence type IV pilus ATPase ComGA n=1 Tax=Hutsoniella sourekii TaxID=87650 RepID=UPI0004834A61|nr:competence type IV pilus ATPase ComGA [Hutsoniella sourekii]